MTIHRCTFRHCTNIACGMYEVTTKRAVTLMVLCADCALDAVPNQIRTWVDGEGTSHEEVRFYKPVLSVSIVHLFMRESTDTLDRLNGAKAHIEGPKVDAVQTLVVYAPAPSPNSKVVTKFRRPLVWQSHQDIQRGD